MQRTPDVLHVPYEDDADDFDEIAEAVKESLSLETDRRASRWSLDRISMVILFSSAFFWFYGLYLIFGLN